MDINSDKDRSSFRHFSEQLRLETGALSCLSIGDSIWSFALPSETGDDHRSLLSVSAPEFIPGGIGSQKLAFVNSNLNRLKSNDDYNSVNHTNKFVGTLNNRNGSMNSFGKPAIGKTNNYINGFTGKKKIASVDRGSNKINNHSNSITFMGESTDKRLKTLPASESLPRSEAIGGYIFVCNNDTMQENLERQLFGLPSRYRDSVRAITPGLPLFLYNYSTHQLFGIFEAVSFGGTNIDPSAWEDKKKYGESRFPAQVRVVTRKPCEPLEEDAFRPFLHHYDGPKFRLELNIPESLALLDAFEEKSM